MKTLDKLMMTIVGLLCFCVSAAALIFMDFSTEHGVVYADALYCIPVCVLLLAFAVLTILKFRTGYDGNLKLAGIVWDVLFALAFLPILGVPAIAQASGAYGLLCKVLFVLHALTEENVMTLLHRALQDERGFGGQKIDMAEDLLRAIAVFANGDARTALSTLEMVILNADLDENGLAHVTPETVAQCTSRRSLLYDKKGDGHYDLISALHKSMRNSDPDAAVYWLARMLESGEDPLYIARRVVRFASEDIGLADSRALETAVAAYQACHFLGMPECTVHLTQAVVYMAMAPKSNALYVAYETAKKDAQEQIAEPVPLQIRNAQTSLMKNLGYGKGYVYAHDTQEKLSAMTCLPDSLQGKRYYQPTEQGNEGRYKQRLEEIIRWKEEHRGK